MFFTIMESLKIERRKKLEKLWMEKGEAEDQKWNGWQIHKFLLPLLVLFSLCLLNLKKNSEGRKKSALANRYVDPPRAHRNRVGEHLKELAFPPNKDKVSDILQDEFASAVWEWFSSDIAAEK